MIRGPRNYIPCLSAWWTNKFPKRREKTDFSDEVEVLLEMVMAQIETLYALHRSGPFPLKYPSAPADGVEPQPSVRSKKQVE